MYWKPHVSQGQSVLRRGLGQCAGVEYARGWLVAVPDATGAAARLNVGREAGSLHVREREAGLSHRDELVPSRPQLRERVAGFLSLDACVAGRSDLLERPALPSHLHRRVPGHLEALEI